MNQRLLARSKKGLWHAPDNNVLVDNIGHDLTLPITAGVNISLATDIFVDYPTQLQIGAKSPPNQGWWRPSDSVAYGTAGAAFQGINPYITCIKIVNHKFALYFFTLMSLVSRSTNSQSRSVWYSSIALLVRWWMSSLMFINSAATCTSSTVESTRSKWSTHKSLFENNLLSICSHQFVKGRSRQTIR